MYRVAFFPFLLALVSGNAYAQTDGDQRQWLRDLKPPDLPVQWDEPIVRLLERYRTEPRGQGLIRGLFEKAGRYAPLIRRELRQARLPEDLVYVAMIESGFDPAALSSAGAVGLWQFVDATADEYGLERTRWVDQRKNPYRSTAAAVRHLADLYQRLGSWELSLAAFNMGYGALLRAMRKYNTNDFWRLSRLEAGLPYETVLYVSKVVAYAVIGRNPERFGLDDLQPEPPVETSVALVPGGTLLRRVARVAGIGKDELIALNPELERSRVPPDVRRWPLRIPAARRAHFLQKWARLRPEVRSHRKIVVRFGERLSDVARRYQTTVKALQELNELGESDTVSAGFQLLVPDLDPIEVKKSEPPVVGVIDQNFVYADRRRVFYRVTKHDTLQEIARFFSVTVEEIKEWNAINADAALIGGLFLQLFVPLDLDLSRAVVLTPNDVRVLVVDSDAFFDYHEARRERIRIRYRVREDDTLHKLAERFDLSIGSLARINGFSSNTELFVGQEIIVYVPRAVAESPEIASEEGP